MQHRSLRVVFGWLVAFLAPWAAQAQDAIATARAVYAEVNRMTATMPAEKFRSRVPEQDYTSEVAAWLENGRVRKLLVTDADDSGNVVTEHYFSADGGLVFTYRAIQGFNDKGRAVTRNESRLYFKGGQLVHLLSGLDKQVVAPSTPDAREDARLTLKAASWLSQVATSPPAPRVKVGTQMKPLEATIVELTAGDVACYLELIDASGRIHTEMADFAICERPESWRGQRVMLGYTQGKVLAPSCQGDPACRKSEVVPLVTKLSIKR